MIFVRKDTKNTGFTIIEVIITIVVLGIVLAMMTPYFGTAISRSSEPISRLKNIFRQTSSQKILEQMTLQYTQKAHWHPGTVYAVNDIVIPTTQNANGFQYICTNAGTSNPAIPAVEPIWPIAVGGTFTESTGVAWRQNGTVTMLTDLQTNVVTHTGDTFFGGSYTINQNEFIKFDPNTNTELTITSADPAYGRYLKVRITDLNSPSSTRSSLFVLR